VRRQSPLPRRAVAADNHHRVSITLTIKKARIRSGDIFSAMGPFCLRHDRLARRWRICSRACRSAAMRPGLLAHSDDDRWPDRHGSPGSANVARSRSRVCAVCAPAGLTGKYNFLRLALLRFSAEEMDLLTQGDGVSAAHRVQSGSCPADPIEQMASSAQTRGDQLTKMIESRWAASVLASTRCCREKILPAESVGRVKSSESACWRLVTRLICQSRPFDWTLIRDFVRNTNERAFRN